MSSQFPGESVLNTYLRIEDMLCDVLRVIPYCPAHHSVWSDALVPVLIESCSLLDSLWKFEVKQSPCVKKNRLTMNDYFTYFGSYLQYKWLVFWGEETEVLTPFENWSKSGRYAPEDYSELDWWKAYNEVKHERLMNRASATLSVSVKSLAGLFLAILRCELCRDAIVQVGWLTGQSPSSVVFLSDDHGDVNERYIAAESKIFSYPVGGHRKPVKKEWKWKGPASHRFCEWFNSYSIPFSPRNL